MSEDTKQVLASAPKRKPPAAGKGRPKGSVNKVTKTIREAIELSFVQIGGADYLAKMATAQPVAYMTLLGKIIPQQMELAGKDGGAIQLEQVRNDADAFARTVASLVARSGTTSAP